MTNYQNETLLLQILSGKIACRINNNLVYIKKPSTENYIRANELYHKEYFKALDLAYTQDEILSLLIELKLWSPAEEKEYLEIDKKIDDEKLTLYNTFVNFGNTERIKKQLELLRGKRDDLIRKRSIFDRYSAEYLCGVYRMMYLVWASAFCAKQRYFKGDFYNASFSDISILLTKYNRAMLNDNIMRKLCKLSKWRILWSLSPNTSSIFRKSTCDLTDNQLSLISWSKFYDNVRKSVECPPDEVIDDDDMIDGWAIAQHNKLQFERNKGLAGKTIDLHKDADEVFIVAHSQQDVARINSLNDSYGRTIQKQKISQTEKHGQISDFQMPCVKQEIIMKINQMKKG